MKIQIPEFALVALIGVTGSGKSTFGGAHFLPTEVISSDFCRALVSDDENDQTASADAFDVLYGIAAKRLKNMKLTVIDATSVQPEDRKRLIELSREYHALPVAIVLDMPESVCRARNALRPDRAFGPHVITRQRSMLKRSLRGLEREGFRRVYVLHDETQVANATVVREPMWTDKKAERGPFDIIGDIHGCFDELVTLLQTMGYRVEGTTVTPPEGRKVVFLGDLVDRGPKIPDVLRLVMGMVAAGNALCIPGNHDMKLYRALKGKKVQITHGLEDSLTQLAGESDEFKQQVVRFLDSLISHFVLDDGRLIVAHAGMKESMAGRASGRVRDFALYGETTGETDEFGLPVRLNWAAEYRGRAMVVYGHTPVPQPEWLNGTINIDTGCVFGGALTALRYPEKELVSVPALQTYVEPVCPFAVPAPTFTAQQAHDDILDVEDVMGKRIIDTRLHPKITIREENATAALEVMSRYAVNPKWLVYLPPTMSPTETSTHPQLLEHPGEAFDFYRRWGIQQVVCEEKHMGSRAVVVVCKDETDARQRFGVTDEGIGVVYTRTGRRFFNDLTVETAFLERVRDAITNADLWAELNTDWMVLDCELMPWSAKAQELLRLQYAPVGAAGIVALEYATAAMAMAAQEGRDTIELVDRFVQREVLVDNYIHAYRRYCWDVTTLDDLTLAPFHLLASEGQVHTDKNHVWHMETLARIARADPKLLMATPYKIVELENPDSTNEGIAWWHTLVERGGEGMVVKPMDFITMTNKGVAQPAVKVRGREYLRIIYGPEYTAPDQIEPLRKRGLNAKRSLALREFALGVEALERFVRHEPLRRVHECVFGVLALESEPVDPRL